ncbi:MAG: SCO family protein [Burkholderiales bacterium]|jgi:protein SCO1|nr:SCO family protein [Burkholderiales bacterium]
MDALRLALCAFCLALLAPSAALHAQAPRPQTDRAVVQVSPFPAGGAFALSSARGPVTLEGMRGKVVLLFFGYVTCPDICPMTLANLQQAVARLSPDERRQVQVAFVTVDPERDTPAILAEYTAAFDLPAVGLTGTPEQIAELAGRYAAQYQRVEMPGSALRYAVNHSAAVYLIDPGGRLRLLLRHTAPPARFADEIRRLLKAANG